MFLFAFLCFQSLYAQVHDCDIAPLFHMFSVQALSPQSKRAMAARNIRVTVGRELFYHEHFDSEREAGAYLRFIIREIESGRCLAQNYIFVHSHDFAWHQTHNTSLINLVDTARHLLLHFNADAHDDACGLGPLLYFTDLFSTPRNNPLLLSAWQSLFPAGTVSPSFCNKVPCCAQFLVSRERLLLYPLSIYRNMLAFQAAHRFVPHQPIWAPGSDPRANVFEHMWPLLLSNSLNKTCTAEELATSWRTLDRELSGVIGDARCFPGALGRTQAQMIEVQKGSL